MSFLDTAWVDPAVRALRPDYSALLLVATGLTPGPSDAFSERALVSAASAAPPVDAPHVVQWREAFRAFGAKPQRTRPSVDALLRRVDALPRIDRLTDTYNAISVRHAVPVGGEDLAAYDGPLRLVRAAGDEDFDTVADGAAVVEHPTAGRGRLARRPRRHLPAVELAAVRAHPDHRLDHGRRVHPRRPGRAGRRRTAGGRRRPGWPAASCQPGRFGVGPAAALGPAAGRRLVRGGGRSGLRLVQPCPEAVAHLVGRVCPASPLRAGDRDSGRRDTDETRHAEHLPPPHALRLAAVARARGRRAIGCPRP